MASGWMHRPGPEDGIQDGRVMPGTKIARRRHPAAGSAASVGKVEVDHHEGVDGPTVARLLNGLCLSIGGFFDCIVGDKTVAVSRSLMGAEIGSGK